MADYEVAWELDFPAGSSEELLLALVVRDLIHGASFDVEIGEAGEIIEIDLYAGDELEGESYGLVIYAEIKGSDDRETLQGFMETILEETIDEAGDLVARGRDLGTMAMKDLEFKPVPEDEERWDLVIPEWLAPDGAEVPFGFRPHAASTGEQWPQDAMLDENGRVLAVPWSDQLMLYGIPAPSEDRAGDEAVEAPAAG